MQSNKIREVALSLRALKAKKIIFTDIDGTIYQWQLLIDLVLVIAKHYPKKRPVVQPLRDAISSYRKRVLPFSIVINILISIIPEVIRGVDKKRVTRFAVSRARSVGSRVYIFPKTLLDVARSITADPWLIVAITGSPQEVADPFCKQLGVHVTIGSFYDSDKKGIYTGERDIDSGINKGAILGAIRDACPEIDWASCIALGDSEHDIGMHDECGYAIAVNPNQVSLEHVRGNCRKISVVRDGQKSGVQIFKRSFTGSLNEICVDCALPRDLAEHFPDLPGMLKRQKCDCKLH